MAAEPVVVRLHIDAPPDVVFECFCDPAALVIWMGDRAEVEPRPGGRFAVDIDDMEVRGEFIVVERPNRLVFSWGFAGSDVPPGASNVEVTLSEDRVGPSSHSFIGTCLKARSPDTQPVGTNSCRGWL